MDALTLTRTSGELVSFQEVRFLMCIILVCIVTPQLEWECQGRWGVVMEMEWGRGGGHIVRALPLRFRFLSPKLFRSAFLEMFRRAPSLHGSRRVVS